MQGDKLDIWFSQMDTENVKTSIRVDKHLFSEQSDYQRIDVFQSQEFGKMIVLDGELDRDMSVQRRTIESYFFPFYSMERNLRRAELDIHLMETQPEEPYNGPVTALLSASYTTVSPISGTEKKPDIVELELIEHNNKGERWRRRYPNCELVTVPGNHNEFLITRESKNAVVDYFLKNV